MSIANLQRAGLLPPSPAPAVVPDAPATALAFALDAGYGPALKVMLASLARAGTVTGLPIHLHSSDPALLDDPFVRAATDRFFHLTGPLAEELERLAAERVRRPERGAWNRGTFLKWAVFQPVDVDQVLFLDADMIALAVLEPLLGRAPSASLVGAPQFPRSLARDGSEPIAPDVLANRLVALMTGAAPQPTRLNSGVMLVRKPLLDDAFRRDLIAHAGRVVCVNEQSHLTAFFAEHPGTLALVEPAWNFHESYLKRLPPEAASRILGEVRILHYAGAQKPWLEPERPARRRSMALWRETAAWAGLG